MKESPPFELFKIFLDYMFSAPLWTVILICSWQTLRILKLLNEYSIHFILFLFHIIKNESIEQKLPKSKLFNFNHSRF